MLQPQLDLSKLVDFVRGTLRSTEEVKSVLEAQCDEAEFVLKPWTMETVVTREVDQNSCTCEVLPVEDSMDEIASGIGMALVHAQRLREKLAANVSREKQKSCEKKVHEIYAPSGRSAASSAARNTAKKAPSLKRNQMNPSPSNKPGQNTGLSLKMNSEKENGCRNQNDEDLKVKENTLKQGSCKDPLNDGKVPFKKYHQSRKSKASTVGDALPKKTFPSQNKSSTSKVSNTDTNLPKGTHKTERSKSSVQSASEIYRQVVGSSKTAKSKSVTEKKLLKPSVGNTLAKRTLIREKPTKNFIAANKSSIKNIKLKESSSTSRSMTNLSSRSSGNLVKHKDAHASGRKSSTLTLSSCTASSTEIEKLISKISLQSQKTLSSSNVKIGQSSCPLHGENTPKFFEERVLTTVDVVEGLDRFGVPQELVKVLKVYHNHLQESLSVEVPEERMTRKAINKFLLEFNAMVEVQTETRQDIFKSEPLVDLTAEFIPLFQDSHDKNLDFINLSKLKIRYTDLDSKCKANRIKSSSPTKRNSTFSEISTPQDFGRGMRCWRNNAIWNDLSITNFEGMTRAQCIRYSNKSQLVLLGEVMQEIQRLEYQKDLIDLLIQDVLPAVNIALNPASEEFVAAYKMIKIISKIMNLTVPVLVRTDI